MPVTVRLLTLSDDEGKSLPVATVLELKAMAAPVFLRNANVPTAPASEVAISVCIAPAINSDGPTALGAISV